MITQSPAPQETELEKILNRFAAYRDQYNREIEYDTSDNADDEQTISAIQQLVAEIIGEDEIKEILGGPQWGVDWHNKLRAEQRQRAKDKGLLA